MMLPLARVMTTKMFAREALPLPNQEKYVELGSGGALPAHTPLPVLLYRFRRSA